MQKLRIWYSLIDMHECQLYKYQCPKYIHFSNIGLYLWTYKTPHDINQYKFFNFEVIIRNERSLYEAIVSAYSGIQTQFAVNWRVFVNSSSYICGAKFVRWYIHMLQIAIFSKSSRHCLPCLPVRSKLTFTLWNIICYIHQRDIVLTNDDFSGAKWLTMNSSHV